MSRACDCCLARSWLLGALAGHLDQARAEIPEVLALADRELIAAVGGRRRAELERRLDRVDLAEARARAREGGLELICRCDPAYPTGLNALPSPPAVLHVAGGLERLLAALGCEAVAIVGARNASPYGLEIARGLGRGMAAAGVPVVSGMARGIDSAAHAGALSIAGQRPGDCAGSTTTVAVLPGSATTPYPRGARGLYRQITRIGAAVSELPPGVAVRRWMFPLRNRVIAALAAMTVVVEAGDRSGALLTAAFARQLGRPLGAVPGRVTTPQAAGPNLLLADGARVVRGPQDVLDALFGEGARTAHIDERPELTSELRALLRAVADGRDTTGALARAGVAPEHGLAALASLELGGYIRREAGGRFVVIP